MSTKPNTSQITYDTGSNKQDLNNILDTVVPITDYDELRGYSGRATTVRITSPGIAGFFQYDSTDTASTDNGGTVIVANTNRWKRVFDGTVNVKWFGAIGDGATDDTMAIQACINSGANVYVPAGRYNITSDLTCSGNIFIHGDGQNGSCFIMLGTSSFLYNGGDASSRWNTSQISLNKLSFLVNGISNKNVIDIRYTNGTGNTEKTVFIKEVKVQGTGPFDKFGKAVYMLNTTNAVIDSVTICGDVDGPPLSSAYGIVLEGNAIYGPTNEIIGGAPVDITIENTSIYFVHTAIQLLGWVEGVHINKCSIVAVARGVNASAYGGRPYIGIIDTHINSSEYGINTINFVQLDFSHNLIYTQQTDAMSTGYIGISVSHNLPDVPGNYRFVENTFVGLITGSKNAIVVCGNGNSFGIISGNLINSFDTGIWLQSGTRNTLVTDTNQFNIINALGVCDEGTNNIICNAHQVVGENTKKHGDGFTHKSGSKAIMLDTDGNGLIPFTLPFTNSYSSGVVCNGDVGIASTLNFVINHDTCNKDRITFSVRPNPGPQLVRVNWFATGN